MHLKRSQKVLPGWLSVYPSLANLNLAFVICHYLIGLQQDNIPRYEIIGLWKGGWGLLLVKNAASFLVGNTIMNMAVFHALC